MVIMIALCTYTNTKTNGNIIFMITFQVINWEGTGYGGRRGTKSERQAARCGWRGMREQ